jgi:hypothetical protein
MLSNLFFTKLQLILITRTVNKTFYTLFITALAPIALGLVSCTKKDNVQPSSSIDMGSMQGKVTPADEAFAVTIVNADRQAFAAKTDPVNGSFSLTDLPAGSYNCFVTAPNGVTYPAGTTTIKTGEKLTGFYYGSSPYWSKIGSPDAGSSIAYVNGGRKISPPGTSVSAGPNYTSKYLDFTVKSKTANDENLVINLKGLTGPGTYSFTDPKLAVATYKYNGIIYSTLRNGSGSVTLTKCGQYDWHLTGTFTFVASPLTGEAGTVTITNGSFDF